MGPEFNRKRRQFLERLLTGGAGLGAYSALSPLLGCATQALNRGPASASLPRPNDRIAVLGAGAAGISAAHFLRRRGYSQIVILEERDRIGGKCDSVQLEARTYDMGAMFATSADSEVARLAQQFGVSTEALGTEGDTLLIDNLEGNSRRKSIPARVSAGAAALAFLVEARKYDSVHRSGFRGLHPDLTLPFGEWMKKHNLSSSLLDSFVGYSFTPFGYGYLNEVPACYALKFYEEKTVNALFAPSKLKLFTHGFQDLWQKVAQGMDVRLNFKISAIEREDETGTVRVLREGFPPEIFRHLIVTCPLNRAARILDCSNFESDLFAKIQTNNFYSFAIETPRGFPRGAFLPVNFSAARAPHPLCWFKRWPDREITLFYALSTTPQDPDTVVKTLFEDAELHNLTLGRVLEARRWEHFPHFSTAELQAGAYDQLEALQGFRRTYLAGEIMNFSSVELVTRYSRYLVEKHF